MDLTKNWIFDDIGRGREDAYFRQKEEELIAALRRKDAAERERQELGDELGVHDEQILASLDALGFSRDTVALLHLFPLLQVAWSDGSVTDPERERIRAVAAVRGVTPGTSAYAMLDRLFTDRPTDHAFETAWRIIRAMLSAWPEEKRQAFEADLPAYATEVARVSGGMLGFGAVSAEERAALDRVAREIAEAHKDAASRVTESSR